MRDDRPPPLGMGNGHAQPPIGDRGSWSPLREVLFPFYAWVRGWEQRGEPCPACGRERMIRESEAFFRCRFCNLRRRVQTVSTSYDLKFWTLDKGKQGLGPDISEPGWERWGSGRLYQMEQLGLLKAGVRSLEMGCAEGALVRALSALGHDAWGADIDPAVLEVVQPRYDKLVLGDTMSLLPAHQEDFDLVHSWHLIEHLRDPFRNELPAMLTLLKPEGFLLAHVPCGGKDEEVLDHLWIFTTEALLCTWMGLGLKDVRLVMDEYVHAPGRFNLVATIVGRKSEETRFVSWPFLKREDSEDVEGGDDYKRGAYSSQSWLTP